MTDAAKELEEKIRVAQEERLKSDGKLVGLTSVGSYDPDIYGGTRNTKFEGYLESIPATEEDEKEEEEREMKRKLPTYTAPDKFLKHLPGNEADEEDPFKQYKRPTIAERQSEYHQRARKRMALSPDRVDGFSASSTTTTTGEARSYKEIMLEHQLEREEATVKRQIMRKKQDEERQKKAEEKKREGE